MAQQGKRHADNQLLLALTCGATVETAAAQARISPSTAYRRLNEPEFQRRLQALRAEMVQRAAGMLTAAAMEAVKTLLSLQHTDQPGAVRLGAARTVLEMGMRLREVADLEQRLAELEQRLDAKDALSA